MGWLFFTVSLIIFGVVLNRINVFLVGYNPPYSTKAYFPSIGEIAMTIAIVSSILFCYRFFVTFFPILPGYVPATEMQLARMREEREKTVNPFWTWVIRGAAIACLLAFIGLYSLVHIEAIQASVRTVEEVEARAGADRSLLPWRRRDRPIPSAPSPIRTFICWTAPCLKPRRTTTSRSASPTGFTTSWWAATAGSATTAIQGTRKTAWGRTSRPSMRPWTSSWAGPVHPATTTWQAIRRRAATAATGCPMKPDDPARIGLKGAYHRQCIGCHERQLKPASAPTECSACHHPWTPDHSILVSLKDKPSPQEVTRTCLSCHPKVGQDLLKTAHWNWKGYSPTLVGYEHRTDISLKLMVNNYCVAIGPNLQQCMSCHIGYGGVDDRYDFKNPANIDCLVCHDTTGPYRKDPNKGGLPDPSLDLVAVSQKVGRPSRQACGSCHFYSGGAANAKHGDLEPALAEMNTPIDMHMGTLNMRCQDCHTTAEHRIAGMSLTAPAVEGRVTCEKCHGSTPHGVAGPLSRHLDDHIRDIACETCHIPSFARLTPTLLRRDYSAAGQDRPDVRDRYGMPTYDKKFGALTWGKDLVPTYLWYDGTRNASLVGDKIDVSSPVVLNAPVGEKRSPAARIYPFKVHSGVQPYDTENKTLALPNFLEDYWVSFDWAKAIAEGMKKVGLPYSGKYGFAETRMYSSIHHEVVSAKKALGCSDCHSSEAITCTRCHKTG